jgi:hypothetical protein
MGVAGALIIAEIERLDRLSKSQGAAIAEKQKDGK